MKPTSPESISSLLPLEFGPPTYKRRGNVIRMAERAKHYGGLKERHSIDEEGMPASGHD